jgi:hypothetical protein
MTECGLDLPADAAVEDAVPDPVTDSVTAQSTSRRTRPPFRADHVGSLLRPARLLQARDARARGELDADGLRAVEDEAIREVVAMQEDVGLQSATDGEFRRASWHMDFIYSLGGINQSEEHLKVQFRNASGVIEFAPAALKVDGPIRLERPIFAEAFDFLAATVRTAVPKLTIPSPSMAAAGQQSIVTSIPRCSPSGTISLPRTPRNCRPCTPGAVATCNWTTPRWPT